VRPTQARPPVPRQTFGPRYNNCTYCDQPSGQGYVGASPIPRLAGQQTDYFKNQLQAFIDRRRVNVFMFKVAHSLSPEMLTALATHFKDLDPKPLGGAPTELVSTGKKSFKREFPMPRFLHVLLVTVQRPKVTGNFLV
jgi:cytochrome c553